MNHPTLELINHPCAYKKRTEPWVPPGNGFMTPSSYAFTVIDSLIHDTEWAPKLVALIDCRQTCYDESFFHVMRKVDGTPSPTLRMYIHMHAPPSPSPSPTPTPSPS